MHIIRIILLTTTVFLGVSCTNSIKETPSIVNETPVNSIVQGTSFLNAAQSPTAAITRESPGSATPRPLLATEISPFPAATFVHNQTVTPNRKFINPVIFFYSTDGHLYRTNIEGIVKEQLTSKPESSDDELTYRPPHISPDGRWLALNGRWGGAALRDLAERVEIGIGRGQAMLFPAWSPDSQRFAYLGQHNQLCIFELTPQTASCPFQTTDQLLIASWSPDGNRIAIVTHDVNDSVGCCVGQVWLLDTKNDEAEIIGSLSFTLEPHREALLTWLPNGSGVLIKSEFADIPSTLFFLEDRITMTFPERIAAMSPNGRYFLSTSGKIYSIDNSILYSLLSAENVCAGEEHQLKEWTWSFESEYLAYTMICPTNSAVDNELKWLQVVEAASGKVVWQQEISTDFLLRAWMPDDNDILLSHQPSFHLGDKSIWHLVIGRMDDPELIVEQGLLLDVIPQWGE